MGVKALGEMWPMDRLGRAENAGDRARLTPLARRVARAVADVYRTRLGAALHSVYLTGAATRGRPGPIEAFGVLRMTAPTQGRAFLGESAQALQARWPAAGALKLDLYDWRSVFPADEAFSPVRFRLGVNSICLAGRDLSRLVAAQRLSVAAANAWAVDLRPALAQIRERLRLARTEAEIERAASDLGRLLLSTGFALLMTQEEVYTEDPDLQRAFVALNNPDCADDARLALEMIETPSDHAEDSLALAERFGGWLASRCDDWLDRHNPYRVSALPA